MDGTLRWKDVEVTDDTVIREGDMYAGWLGEEEEIPLYELDGMGLLEVKEVEKIYIDKDGKTKQVPEAPMCRVKRVAVKTKGRVVWGCFEENMNVYIFKDWVRLKGEYVNE